jgi:putative ABC transport system permease protein
MMPDRPMFWRILRRIFASNRGRLAVVLLALGSGAAITAALLNLEVDAKRRLTTEFRAFGANVIITPRESDGTNGAAAAAMDSSLCARIPKTNGFGVVARACLLYGIVDAAPDTSSGVQSSRSIPVVLAGYDFFGNDYSEIFPSVVVAEDRRYLVVPQFEVPLTSCELGELIARRLGTQLNQSLVLQSNGSKFLCFVHRIRRYGGPEDSQVFVPIAVAQKLLDEPSRVNTIAVTVPGNPSSVQSFISVLQATMPGAQVRPIRQFTEGEAKIYNRISGILSATVAVVLILTALCVMAAMTNVAMERRNDVGLMKAIGGATRRVLRLFLAEAALLGLTGGMVGAALGILLSIWLGKQVFGQPAHPRLIVYPVAVALTMIVAIAGAYPLRRLASIRPASVFRGEG